jgi:hypothetical protein
MPQTNSNRVSQLVLSGLKEIIGVSELAKIVSRIVHGEKATSQEINHEIPDVPDCDLEKMQVIMENQFGQKGMQGLMVRSGRASCKFFVKEYGSSMKVTSMEYRLLPSKKRLMIGLQAAAGLWSELFTAKISVVDQGDYWVWQETEPEKKNSCPHLSQNCYFTIGLIQEYLSWMSGGKVFSVKKADPRVQEQVISCLRINKQPID